MEWILREIPPSVLTHWEAAYLMSPWDTQEAMANAEIKYRPPSDVQAAMKKAEAGKKKSYMTGREIRQRMKEAGY